MGIFMKQRLKILCASVFVAALCGVRLEAQENVGAWSSVETGPVISQSVPMNVKTKTSERIAAATEKFARSSTLATSGFPGNQVGPRIFRPEQNTERSFRSSENADVDALTPPLLVSIPEAVPYPKKAVRRGWEGRVVLAYEVLPDGSVGRIEFAQSSGHALLDETARESIGKWKFRPALRGDRPVRDVVETPVTFKLESQS
jgi:TonB family protein